MGKNMFKKEKVTEYIWTILIPTIITFIISWVGSYYNGTSTVSIGQPTKVSGQYITPINISPYHDIKELRITFPQKLDVKQISSNEPINVKSDKNNIGVESNSTFEIAKIVENNSVQLLITTQKKLNDKEIRIDKNGNNISVNYESQIVNPAKKQLINLIITSSIYFIMLNILALIMNKRWDKYYAKMKNEIKEFEDNAKDLDKKSKKKTEELSELRKTLNQAFEETDRIKYHEKKKQILLLAKLNDYKKELTFWRNTIRKVLYELPDGDKKADKLIGTVTSSLKTYGTVEKNEHDYESLKVAAALLNDSDKRS
ncbi:hypothetical protein ABEY03_16345 [Bacillus inaquosorum]|uniref:hypothetical protein n=1 Tax=Bacillus inaquosorum TaxID=483913 RepID=UPI003D2494FD